MTGMLFKAIISASVIVAVAKIAGHYPRIGALLLTLPVVSMLAFIMTWHELGKMSPISRLARETLVLVPLSLPFFVPFIFADRTGLSFWPSFALGLMAASTTIGVWFWVTR